MRDTVERPRASILFVLTTMFLAFALEFVPWPEILIGVRPVFPMLALTYWAMHNPRLINYAAAVILGLLIDLANQTTFGFNVAACSVVVFMTNAVAGRFVLLGGFGQAVHIFAVLAAGQLTFLALEWLFGDFSFVLEWRLFYPSMTAAAMWGALPFLMHSLRHRFFGRADEGY